MLDVLRGIEARGDLQAQDVDVKLPASFDVVALQGAVSESLRHVAASGKALIGQGIFPVSRRVRAAVQRAAGIVVLDLEMIAAGLAEIDRVGEVGALRFGDLA